MKPFTPNRTLTFYLVVIFVLCLAAHSHAQEKLYTKLISISGPKANEKRDSVFTEVKDTSFTISLNSMAQGTYYIAQRAIHRSKITEEYKWITLYLTTEKGNDLTFKDSAEFIQYMSNRGYKMDSETKERFRTDYVFSKQ